jgi:hypothetical protein
MPQLPDPVWSVLRIGVLLVSERTEQDYAAATAPLQEGQQR